MKFPLEIEERLLWLDRAVACLADQPMLSEDVMLKRSEVEEAIARLHLQQAVRDKLKKVISRENDAERREETRHLWLQFSYLMITDWVYLLHVASSHSFYLVELRILEHLHSTWTTKQERKQGM